MTLPTTQVFVFNTSELFRGNPGMLEPTFQQLRAAGVNAPLYSGLEVDNPNVGFIVINWDTYEQHQEIVKAPFYAELGKSLAPAIASSSKVYHAQLSGSTAALDKPVTEIVFLTLKNPENRAAVAEILSGILEFSKKLLAFGQTREDENKYIGMFGWESVEARKQAASKPESQVLINKLSSLTDKESFYFAKLRKF